MQNRADPPLAQAARINDLLNPFLSDDQTLYQGNYHLLRPLLNRRFLFVWMKPAKACGASRREPGFYPDSPRILARIPPVPTSLTIFCHYPHKLGTFVQNRFHFFVVYYTCKFITIEIIRNNLRLSRPINPVRAFPRRVRNRILSRLEIVSQVIRG